MVRAALFDVDGTLLDSNELHVQAWQQALRDYGIEVPREALRQQMGNGGDQLVLAVCGPQRARKLSKKLIERHVEVFARDYIDQVRPFPGVRELFERLRADGVQVALASSAQKWERDRHIELLGIGHLLDGATTGEAIDHAKPCPDVFQTALRSLVNVAPREAVVVGDSPYDALAARSAGMQAIGVLSGGFSARILRAAGARPVLRDLQDLLRGYPDGWTQASAARGNCASSGPDAVVR